MKKPKERVLNGWAILFASYLDGGWSKRKRRTKRTNKRVSK